MRLTMFLALAWVTTAFANSIEDLAREPLIKDVQISPDGNHLGLRIFNEGSHSIRFIRRKDMKVVGGLALGARSEVGEFHWVSNKRVVAEVWEVPLSGDKPRYYGELVAGNVDGKRRELIFGYRAGEDQVGSLIPKKGADFARAEIIDVLPEDEDMILISSTPMSVSQERRPFAMELEVLRGKEGKRIVGAKHPNGKFFTDRDGVIRVIYSEPEGGGIHLEMLPEEGDWISLPEQGFADAFEPLAITDDLESVLAIASRQGDRAGLYRIALDGSEVSKLYEHERVDITRAMTSTDGRAVYAVRVDDGLPSHLVFSSAHEEAGVFRALLGAFPGAALSIRSQTADGKLWIVKTESDRDAGSYYLFDRENNRLGLIFETRPDLDADALAEMRAISFDSFDETRINGYLSRPAGVSGDEATPLIVLVHDGPGERVYWSYDPVVQVLTSRGYSVLQLNYRGSSGYGKAFLEAGHGQWDGDIQRDVIAGTRWAIEQGYGKAGQICVMGTGFGGYSAVMSATRAPDLFACVVSNAGLYDLSMMYEADEIDDRFWGIDEEAWDENFLLANIGRDREDLIAASPISHAGKLEVPVMISHARQDKRVPFRHAQRMRRALEAGSKRFEWYVQSREGQSFYSIDRVEYLQRVVGFIDDSTRLADSGRN